ncbi:glutamate receptor ionotropic, kainate 4-like isoform X2 [Myxocyprinus asiaticus]|uniref:glutamate receptor ionotropic, kainate 4-like isoform X2 n=1 Tax=Myxocyprinus asiaticus TaxID=70543 RepID=UPI002223AC92|nr:glutamate receptor ionotropic, kainate 4-like isoform X2 [Myxocyprinus asiaticus]
MLTAWAPLLFLAMWVRNATSGPLSFRLAAILDDPMECSRGERLAITLAKDSINRSSNRSTTGKLEVDIFELLRDSEYETGETMCQIMSKGVVAVLGPSASPASNSIISNICGEKEVPYVKVAPEDILKVQFPRFTTLDLRPTNTDISMAVAGLLTFFNSSTSCLICAQADCLLNLEVLLRQFLISKETLSVRMLDDSQDPTPLLKEIRDDKTATIIVDANVTMSHIILERASELGMLSVYYTYILTSLEFSLLQLDDLADQRVNIVGFSVFNRTHPFFKDFVLSLNRSWQENCDHAPFAGTPLSSALMFDAVHTVVAAVQELNRSQNVGATQLSCKSSKIWEHGTSLMNYLRMVELEGLTGHIEFNSKGQRSNYALRILQNSRDGLRQIGQWHSELGLSMERKLPSLNVTDTLFNTTLTITTILENPYVMLRTNHQELEGNDRYEGFCVDMLKELADILKFKYRIRLVGDGVYGVPGANGTWTGMVGELISRKADLAVAALTITAEREKVIDFSKPFMTLGISIMYRMHINSRYQTYQRMWNFMYSKQPSVFVKSTEEGIARVLNSNYAYLLESTMNEYYRQRNCNLTQIGGLLDTKGYGIGMPLGSVYRDEFDMAILKLQEENRLEILKRIWWDGGKCPKEENQRAKGLGMENIGGIFVVLVCGLLVAIFMAVLEFVWMLHHTPGTELSVCEEMLRELQGIMLCQDSLQLRRRRRASVLRPQPMPLDERRARAAAASLSNGKLCTGTGLPEPLSHRLAQEAALVARGCSHIRICPECRRFQGIRVCPAGPPGPSRTNSEESIEWEKGANNSEHE